MVNYDLENSPLEIKTDSAVGSNQYVRVFFYQSSGSPIGGIGIKLSTTPRYYFYKCHNWVSIPTNIPIDKNWIWRITITSDPLGIVIHCNDKEIPNMKLSDTTCTEKNWRSYWGQEIKKIKFSNQDTASDFYYHLPGKKEVYIKV